MKATATAARSTGLVPAPTAPGNAIVWLPVGRFAPRSASTQIGNSRPFAACVVRMRTASSSGSGGTTSSTRTSSAVCSLHHARKDRRSPPRASPYRRAVSRKVRIRRHESRGRWLQSASSIALRSRTTCSTRLAAPVHGRRACMSAIQVMPSTTAWSDGNPDVPGCWWSHLPPPRWNARRSSSPQPKRGDRRAVTRASSSVGSSIACSAMRMSRTSLAAHGLVPASMRWGTRASASAAARSATGFRLRTRIAMSPGVQGYQPSMGGPPCGSGSARQTVQPSASAVVTAATTSVVSSSWSWAAVRLWSESKPRSVTAGPTVAAGRVEVSGAYSG